MNIDVAVKRVRLKKKEEQRVIEGHPWVFSNQIEGIEGMPGAGDLVSVFSSASALVGTAFYNPHSLIACRILDRTALRAVDADLIRERIRLALALRDQLYPGEPSYRVVHGEADFLPGLIIDRYNDYFSVQTLSYGMDLMLPVICDVLEDVFKPKAIIERNESPLRTLEQLPLQKKVLRGTVDETVISFGGIRFRVNPMEGQKTGWYLDQRENRKLAARFARGQTVLDCFCNDGGFSLSAAAAGATSVLGIDSSSDAILRAQRNTGLNDLSGVTFEQGDVFEHLKKTIGREARYGMVILDPPSFTRNKKNVQTAKKGYRDLHMFALRALTQGGILATASCSHHIGPETFLECITRAADRVGRKLQQLAWQGASPDHPTLPSVPETAYLKFGIFRVH